MNRIDTETYEIHLPEGFSQMSQEELKVKKILMPDSLVYTNGEDIYITVSTAVAEEEISDENLKRMYAVLSRVTPGFVGLGAAKKMVNGFMMGAFQYKSNGLVNDLYNTTMLFVVSGKQVTVTGHCDWEVSEKWKPVFFNIAESVIKK